MKAPFYSLTGEKTKEALLPKDVFGQEAKPELIHQVAVAQQANRRIVRASTKDRSEVSGGGRKPWRQKGTGRARHGSIRSPIWAGGGITFGPTKERVYKQKINRRMARQALIGVLNGKARDGQVMLVDDPKVEKGQTKEVAGLIDKLPRQGSALFLVPAKDRLLRRAARNLADLEVGSADQLTALRVLSFRHLIITKAALSELKDKLGS